MRKLILSVAALAAFALAPLCAGAQTISRGQTGAVGTIVTCTDASGVTSQCVLPMATPVTAAGVEKGTVSSPMVTTPATGSSSTVKIDQTTPGTTNGVAVNAALPAGANIIGKFGIDQTTPGTTNAVVPAGNVAGGATDSGNPVKVGGVYNTTPPALSTGQRGDLQLDSRGSLHATIVNPDSTGVPFAATNSDGQAGSGGLTALLEASRGYLFNGATWDRSFTCSNSAVVNVTAAATTQIVALSASAQVRVCSIALTMSAAGTAKVLYGTGSNCGTGPVDLTGSFTLATGTPLQLSAPSGGSLFRTAASNALCIAAVTGNVTGVITYAQF